MIIIKLYGSSGADNKRNSGSAGKKRKKKVPAALIAVIAVLVVIIAVLAAGCVYVSSIDTIYPKISIDGVNLGGMDIDAASSALERVSNKTITDEALAGKVSVTLKTSTGKELVITGEDIGLDSSEYARSYARALAKKAMDYGRDGGFIKNAFSYLKCAVKGAELDAYCDSSSILSYDSDYVYETVYTFAEAVSYTHLTLPTILRV